MKGFEKITELLRSDSEVQNLLKLDNSMASSIIKSHISHIEDPHFKVNTKSGQNVMLSLPRPILRNI